MSWLTGYGYRKSHVINPATGAGTNYAVRIKAHKNFTAPYSTYSDNPLMRQMHPDVHYFPAGIDGYKYWMSYTPYPPESSEHPCIRRSNDGINWVDDGITNPVVNHVGYAYDADPDMIYVADCDKWFMIWAPMTGAAWGLAFAYSSDGKTWTEYDGVAINGNTDPIILSGSDSAGVAWERLGAQSRTQYPSLYYNSGTFYLFYGNNEIANGGAVGYATFTWNNSTNDIENFQRCATNPILTLPATGTYKEGCGHIDISKYGSTWYLYCVRSRVVGVNDYDVCLATSDDLSTWTNQGAIITIGATGRWDADYEYRACPVVDGEGNQILIDSKRYVYYSAVNENLVSGIGLAQETNLFDDQVNLNNHCEDDFGDIRFTSDDEVTELDYWIEYKSDGDYAFIWVKVPGDLSTATKSIYIYYSKTGQATSSDIQGVFLKADDGTAGNFDEEVVGSSVFSHSGGKYKNTGSTLIGDAWASGGTITDWNKYLVVTNNVLPTGTGNIEWALYDSADLLSIIGLNAAVINMFRFGITRTNGININIKYLDPSNVFQFWNGHGWQNTTVNYQLNTTDDLSFKIWSDGTNLYCDILNNGISILTKIYYHDVCSIPIASIKSFSSGVCYAWSERKTDLYFVENELENYFVRTYVDPEPSHGAWGDEEPVPSLTIVYPNGGESIYAGDVCDITWLNVSVEHAKLLLSIDNGSNWTEINPSILASLQIYSWLIQSWAVSDQCLVKIIGVEEPEYYDTSDAVFEILEDVTESIVITAPNGGETYYTDEVCNITWSSVGLTHVQILYSTNNGSSWTQIVASVLGSLGTYSWTVPVAAISTNCLIKIIGVEKPAYYDTSDTVFTVKTDSITSWAQVAAQLNSQVNINSLIEYNSKLYGGTSTGGRLFRFDTDHWTQIADQLNDQTDILCMIIHNGNLFAGTAQEGCLFRLE